jgi:non-ribosomal peptide synthetase component E (peptide arylation enzyme)
MRIPDPPIDPARIAQFMGEGYWVETTSNDALEQGARGTPDKLAIADGRVRLGYGEYYSAPSGLRPISSRWGSAPMMSSRSSCRIGANLP